MDFDTEVKLALYRRIAATAEAPTVADVADDVRRSPAEVREAYRRLYRNRVLVLEPDGETIRMARARRRPDAVPPDSRRGRGRSSPTNIELKKA